VWAVEAAQQREEIGRGLREIAAFRQVQHFGKARRGLRSEGEQRLARQRGRRIEPQLQSWRIVAGKLAGRARR